MSAATVWESMSDESNKESIGIHDFGPRDDKNSQVRNCSNHVERVDGVSKLEHARNPLLLRHQRNHPAAVSVVV